MPELDPRLSGYYKRASAFIKIIRFGFLIGFVAFSLFCIGYFRDNITMDNIRYLFKYIDLSFADNTPSEAEISISTDDESTFTLLGNDLAVVSGSGVDLYSFSGNKLYNYSHNYANPAVSSSGDNLLVYDSGGKGISLYSPVSKVLENLYMPFEHTGIRSAYINKAGNFAIICSERASESGFVTFDRDGIWRFTWTSTDKTVTDVALNKNASRAICSAVYNQNGSFYSDLLVFDTSLPEQTPLSLTFEEELILKIGYALDDSVIFVLTDSKFICLDKSLNIIGETSYSTANARFYKAFDDCFIIVESNNLSGSSMTVSAYSYNCEKLFSHRTEKRISDLAYKDRALYLLGRNELEVFDYGTNLSELTKLASLPIKTQSRAVLADGYGRFILIENRLAKRSSLKSLLESQLG